MPRNLFLPALFSVFLLAACSDWMGDEEEPPLPGERISLRESQKPLLADIELEGEKVVLPAMPVNAAWPQAMGNATGVSGNLAFTEAPSLVASVKIGDGNEFASPLIPAPVVAENMIFAMDGRGVISAHALSDPEKIYWTSSLLNEADEEGILLGGGLAWAKGTLFAANDAGMVAGFNANTGGKRWVKELKLPLRSPPRVAGDLVLILTADNQLLALQQGNGELQWSQRGISEVAGALHATPPAVRDGTIIVSYSSGEISGLDLKTGNQLWTDSLADSGPQSVDSANFNTVSPVMATGISFAGSSSLLAAFESEGGRRLWDRTIPTYSAPWLAGNYLFLVTPKGQLAAVRGLDGGLQWVRDLPRNDGKKTLWYGPVVAEGRVWVIGENGWLVSYSPQDGQDEKAIEVAEGIRTAPVIADKTMVLIDKTGRMHVLK